MMIDNKSNNNNNKQFVSKKGYYFNYLQFSNFFLAFLCKNNGTFWDAHPGPSSFLVFL